MTQILYYDAAGHPISYGDDGSISLPSGAIGYTYDVSAQDGSQIWVESDGVTVAPQGVAGVWRLTQGNLLINLGNYRYIKEISGVTFHSPSLSADVTVATDDASMAHWWSTIFSALEQTQTQSRMVKCVDGSLVSVLNSEFPLLRAALDVLTQGAFDTEAAIKPNIANNTILTEAQLEAAFDAAFASLSVTRTYISPTPAQRLTIAEGNISTLTSGATTTNSNVSTLQANMTSAQSSITTLTAFAATKGAANGLAPLDGSGLVSASNLPSYVDDVLEYANFAALPGTGETGKIYVLDTPYTAAGVTSAQFRWSGSAYIAIIASPGSTDSVTEGTTNLYYLASRVLAGVLTGLSTASNAAITASDTILSALGKAQAQINALATAIATIGTYYYKGVLKTGVVPLTSQATVGASGAITFYLTKDMTSGGTAAFSEVYPESVNAIGSGYPYSFVWGSVSMDKKSITATVYYSPATTIVLGGIVQQAVAPSGTVINATFLGKAA